MNQSPLPPTFRSLARENNPVEKRKKKKKSIFRKLRKPLIWGLFFLSIYWFFNPHGVFVLGDPLSVYRYRTVLNDLKREMPNEYRLVRNHIDKISISYMMMGNRAGEARENKDGEKQVRLLENTFVQGPGYAHSVLVHEACHGLQFEKNLPFTPFCDNQSREHACNEWGIRVLKKFNGKPSMIKHYENISRGSSVYGNSCVRDGTLEKMPIL